MIISNKIYTYNTNQVVSFAKTTGKFGGFSNMAPGFILFVNEILVPNTESLYQACKFSIYPEIQREIIEAGNPMMAKKISRRNQDYVRSDWEQIKFSVMEWCVKIKLLQNWDKFSELLRESGSYDIVEYSTNDSFWGAIPTYNNRLEGQNVLGRLLMSIRSEYVVPNIKPNKISPPNIIGLMLYGALVTDVHAPEYYIEDFF